VAHFGQVAVPEGMDAMVVPHASGSALAADTSAFYIPRNWFKENPERQQEVDHPWGTPPQADGPASAPPSDLGSVEVFQEEERPGPAVRFHRDSAVLRYQARNRADYSRPLFFQFDSIDFCAWSTF
jgi:hypothetical protein